MTLSTGSRFLALLYSQELLHTWNQWPSPEAEGSQGTILDPGAPRPIYLLSPSIPTSPSVHQVGEDRLCLLQLDEWDQEKDYSADPPICIRYTIIWKIKLNNRMIAKDTEQDVVLGPATYWSMFLQPLLDALLSKKISNGKRIRPDDSNVLVSVNERSERDLTRRFDEVQVDWSVVEKQLQSWGELLHAGKRLRVDISFNYVEIQAALPARGSTTQRMLAERAAQLDAEEASGTPSTWRDVYALMRCPGAPCDLGPHCWRDPDGKKHYPLKAHHMRSLIKHVDEGNSLESHADVPQVVRQQLYAEQQERSHKQHKSSTGNASSLPPITINNVLPGSTSLASGTQPEPAATASATEASLPRDFELPGFRDVALTEYSKWHQSRVFNTDLKADFQKAEAVTLENALDLDLIYEENDPDFFEKQGMKMGARRTTVGEEVQGG